MYGRLKRSQCRLIKYVWRMIMVNWSRSKCTTTLEQTILGSLYRGRYTVGFPCVAVCKTSDILMHGRDTDYLIALIHIHVRLFRGDCLIPVSPSYCLNYESVVTKLLTCYNCLRV